MLILNAVAKDKRYVCLSQDNHDSYISFHHLGSNCRLYYQLNLAAMAMGQFCPVFDGDVSNRTMIEQEAGLHDRSIRSHVKDVMYLSIKHRVWQYICFKNMGAIYVTFFLNSRHMGRKIRDIRPIKTTSQATCKIRDVSLSIT